MSINAHSLLMLSASLGVKEVITPNTIVPPLVLANAEKERQNSAFGNPPAADLYSISELSFS